MKAKILICIILFTVIGLAQTITELTKMDLGSGQTTQVAPAHSWKYESFESVVVCNGSVYMGTRPNSHILKMPNPTDASPKTYRDLGRVVKDGREANIYGMTSDDYFVYGASSPVSKLFFVDRQDRINVLSTDILKQHQLYVLKAPIVYKPIDDHHYQYILFGAGTPQGELKVVRWRVEVDVQTGEPVPSVDDSVDIISLNATPTTDNSILSMSITIINNEPILICGDGEEHLILYNFNTRSSEVRDLGFSTRQAITSPNKNGHVYLFDDTTECKDYDILLNTLITIINFDVTDYDSPTRFLSRGNFIYTHKQRLDVSDNSLTTYPDATIHGRRIMYYGGKLFGLSKWGAEDKPKLEIINETTLQMVTVPDIDEYPLGYQSTNGWGGADIGDLQVFEDKIFFSMGVPYEFTYFFDSNSPYWITNHTPTGNNINAIIANSSIYNNGKIYYGFYPGPVFAERDVNVDTFNFAIDLRSYQLDQYQVRVSSIAKYDNYIFFGTCGREESEGTRAGLFQYNMLSHQLQMIGQLEPSVEGEKGQGIYSLAAVPHNSTSVKIIGATGVGVFVYDVPLNERVKDNKKDVPTILVSPEPDDDRYALDSYSLLYANRLIMLRNYGWGDTYLRVYRQGWVPSASLLANPDYYYEFELRHEQPHIGGEIILGNNNNIYVLYSTAKTLRTYIEEYPLSNIIPRNRRILYDYENCIDQNNAITHIQKNLTNSYDHNIYFGTLRGRLYKMNPSLSEPPIYEDGKINIQVYPNPFNPTTKIEFALNKPEQVRLEIFSILGEVVRTVVNDNLMEGLHTYSFDGTKLSSGIYFCHLSIGAKTTIQKMILLK